MSDCLNNSYESNFFYYFIDDDFFKLSDENDSYSEENDKNQIQINGRYFSYSSTNSMYEEVKKVPFPEKQYETAKCKQEDKNNNFIGKKRIIFKTDKLRDSKLYNTGKMMIIQKKNLMRLLKL